MARRTKMTGFARFFLVLIILVPLAFIGASYLNGEDPMANFRKLIAPFTGDQTEQVVEPEGESEDPESVDTAQEEDPTSTANEQATPDAQTPTEPDSSPSNSALQSRMRELEEANAKMQEQLDEQDKKIKWLEQQVQSLQEASAN